MSKNILEYLTNLWYALVRKKLDYRRNGYMNKTNINRNIIENSYYLISLFEKDSKEITNLKLQKLMYFIEAYYMAKNDSESELFDSEWSAWNYGPVNIALYNYYKKFGGLPIVLTEEEKQKGTELFEQNKIYIDKIYEIFGGLSAFKLVTLTHLDGSPWSEIYKNNQKNKEFDFEFINKSKILKIETKNWIKKQFSFLFNEEQ